MTLKQLHAVITIAKEGSITKAAQKLFITQPSLTNALKELESELGIQIFYRSRNGVSLTSEGEEFLGYARQILEQAQMVEERYGKRGNAPRRRFFAVSTQHYSFAVEAFVSLLNRFGGENYEFHLRETQTWQIMDDVAKLRSEIGILYMNSYNQTVIERELHERGLVFTRLFHTNPYVFLGSGNPLAGKKVITLEDLKQYPRLSYEQGAHNSFYYSEEILSERESEKDIVVCDRATLFNLLIGMNGYTICSGVISEELNGPNIIARPLDVADYMDIGYILAQNVRVSEMTEQYIEELKRVLGREKELRK